MANGIHHITAICGKPKQCVQFYVDVLGMRLVKKTVNFDDPFTYHLYFGDAIGTPGTALTFFPFKGAPQGKPGAGQVLRTVFAAPKDSREYWFTRLTEHNVSVIETDDELHFEDRDGMLLGIAFKGGNGSTWNGSSVNEEYQLRGFDHAVLAIRKETLIPTILTKHLSMTQDNNMFATENGYGSIKLQIHDEVGESGVGTVHHIAFSVDDYKDQQEHMMKLRKVLHTTDIVDREYFTSIYFRVPEGILFELATLGPGFTVDESEEELGSSLQLPPWYEKQRDEIEKTLPELN